MHFRIKKGLDLPVEGAPDPGVDPAPPVTSPVSHIGLNGADYVGLEPRLLVSEGDRVSAGAPLLEHKRDPDVAFTAPGSGRVLAVRRGARRVLKSVVIELDDARAPAEIEYAGETSDIRAALLQSGLWTAFRARPFGHIPHSSSDPRAIFVTAMDTRPLSGDPGPVIAGNAALFARGLEALRDLSPAPVFLCTAPDWPGPVVDGVQQAAFEGPHPAGLPGTHIHHLDPVGADRIAWYLGWQDVIAMGGLFADRRIRYERLVALGGNGVLRPRWVRTRLGANIRELTAGELRERDDGRSRLRVISGSVLCGREIREPELWLGRYHDQICAIENPAPGRRLRWRRLVDGRFSFAGTFARQTGAAPRSTFSTDQNGRATALVPIDAFEKLIPMDVLTEPLLRALLVGDTDQAQALGALELEEEDLALCSFVCPGKNDYGAVLRVNLERIEREG